MTKKCGKKFSISITISPSPKWQPRVCIFFPTKSPKPILGLLSVTKKSSTQWNLNQWMLDISVSKMTEMTNGLSNWLETTFLSKLIMAVIFHKFMKMLNIDSKCVYYNNSLRISILAVFCYYASKTGYSSILSLSPACLFHKKKKKPIGIGN